MAQIPGNAYSFKDIRDGLPYGTYQCQVSKTDINTNAKGDTYLVFTLRVLYGTEANRTHSVRFCHECVSDKDKKSMLENMGRRRTKDLGIALGFADNYVLTDTDDYLNKTCEMTLKESKNPSFPDVSFREWTPGTPMATPTTPIKKTAPQVETVASDDDVPW